MTVAMAAMQCVPGCFWALNQALLLLTAYTLHPKPKPLLRGQQRGDAFDLATVLVSLLLGAGYNAFVAMGYAPAAITLDDHTREPCPCAAPDAGEALGLGSGSGSNAWGGGDAAEAGAGGAGAPDRAPELAQARAAPAAVSSGPNAPSSTGFRPDSGAGVRRRPLLPAIAAQVGLPHR